MQFFLQILGEWKGILATKISSFDRNHQDDVPAEKFIEVGERTPRNSYKISSPKISDIENEQMCIIE